MSNNCGRKGSWAISFTYVGDSYVYTNYCYGNEFDEPYYQLDPPTNDGCYNRGSIYSACDGRVLIDRWSCYSKFSIVKTVFTVDPSEPPDPPKSATYDCINGECIDSTKYSTAGYYKSLDDCKKKCGFSNCGDGKICIDPNNYCPDNKVCIDKSEYDQINQLISKISGEIC